jgi:hypothetical protein
MRLGSARQVFLSADESSNVVGHTSDLLLEVDESQDINQDKYSKEFRPMASSTNATTVHYGTNQTINFYVDPLEGHDDYLMSLPLSSTIRKHHALSGLFYEKYERFI